jgi:hypothetical protein
MSGSDKVKNAEILDCCHSHQCKSFMGIVGSKREVNPYADFSYCRPFAPIPTRRYTALPFESQGRLVPVPEEECSAEERLTSPEEIFRYLFYFSTPKSSCESLPQQMIAFFLHTFSICVCDVWSWLLCERIFHMRTSIYIWISNVCTSLYVLWQSYHFPTFITYL